MLHCSVDGISCAVSSTFDRIFTIFNNCLIAPCFLRIFFIKRGVSWYYKRKISRNQEKLTDMQKEKKKILEEVTETETYKKAKEILLKYAPDQLRMTPVRGNIFEMIIFSIFPSFCNNFFKFDFLVDSAAKLYKQNYCN